MTASQARGSYSQDLEQVEASFTSPWVASLLPSLPVLGPSINVQSVLIIDRELRLRLGLEKGLL